MDDIGDMGNIGNEIYFKKDENEIDDNRMPSSTIHEQTTEGAHAGLDENNEAENNILETDNWKTHGTPATSINRVLGASIKPTTTTTTTSLTSSERSHTHQTTNSKENLINENETIPDDDMETFNEDISNEIKQKNETSQMQPTLYTETLNKGNLIETDNRPSEHDQRVVITTTPSPSTIPPTKPSTTLPATYHNKIYKENSVIKSNDIIDNNNWDEDEADYSYEDFAVEYNGRTVVRQNKIRNHTSYQTSMFRRPLMQGFLATTGYPKFYIGESNCTWRISAPIGRRVRVTVLDINLRCKLALDRIDRMCFKYLMFISDDVVCKDLVQVYDLEIGQILFNSCSEHARPIQVLSDSNHILVGLNDICGLTWHFFFFVFQRSHLHIIQTKILYVFR